MKNNVDKDIEINDVIALIGKKDYITAYDLCNRLLKCEPDNAETLYFLGFIQLALNKINSSKQYFSKMLTSAEKKIGTHCFNIADSYYKAKLYDEALDYYQKSIIYFPNKKAEIYNSIGITYRKKDDYDMAIKYFNMALELKPKYIHSIANLALVNQELGNFSKAIELCKKVISMDADYPQAYYYWGLALADDNKPLEAIPLIKKAIDVKPDYNDPYGAYAIYLLMTKNFKDGWKAYESRFKGINTPVPSGGNSEWKGESLNGKRIYLFHEQGKGDTIQFVRYLPLLKKMGAKVFFKPQPDLEELIKNSNIDGTEIVDSKHYLKSNQFDYYLSLLSLPYRLNATDKNIPLADGYLKANPKIVAEYKEKYFKKSKKIKVGIFWQGNPHFGRDKKRSVKLEHFYNIVKLKNIQLYSLQKGLGEEQLENLPKDVNIINLGNTFKDFSDTAAAVENLDLVISSDSSVAHLAGAMGKSVWLLLDLVGDWRWFGAKYKSIWYDSMRIFRQTKANDWDGVFKRIYNELKTL